MVASHAGGNVGRAGALARAAAAQAGALLAALSGCVVLVLRASTGAHL